MALFKWLRRAHRAHKAARAASLCVDVYQNGSAIYEGVTELRDECFPEARSLVARDPVSEFLEWAQDVEEG